MPSSSGRKALFRVNASLFGKFAAVFIDREGVEVRTMSTLGLLLILWLGTLAVLFLCLLLIPSMLLIILLTLGFSLGLFLVMTRLLRGRLERRMEYKDITSFVRNDPEFTFTLRDHYRLSVKMSPRRQDRIQENLLEVFQDHPGYRLVQKGKYLQVAPRNPE